jgi:hypothetical protein
MLKKTLLIENKSSISAKNLGSTYKKKEAQMPLGMLSEIFTTSTYSFRL